jgi:hypothetical protein
MKLAIADPPYPPIRAAHPRNDSFPGSGSVSSAVAQGVLL